MSFLAIKDMVFGDILGEHNLKPVWEKFRGYIFAGTVVCALHLVYETFAGIDFHCLPEGQNTSEIANFSTVQAAFVNSYCRNSLPFYHSNCGILCVAMAAIILFLSTFWLHIPDASGQFCTLADVEKCILSLEMTLEELKKLSFEPTDNKSKEQRKLLAACMMLWKLRYKWGVRQIYNVRCYLLMGISIVFTACSVLLLISFAIRGNQTLSCSVVTTADLGIEGDIKPYTCSSGTDWKFFSSLLAFTISLLGQFFLVAYGQRVISRIGFEGGTSSVEMGKARETAMFLATFWKHSRPVRSGVFWEFIEYIFSSELFRKKMKIITTKYSIDSNDFQLLSDFSSDGLIKFKDLIRIAPPRRIDGREIVDANTRKIVRTLQIMEYGIDECKDFVLTMYRKKMGILMSATLDNCREPETKHEFRVGWLSDENLNLDEIFFPCTDRREPNVDLEAGSLLYYALSEKYRNLRGNFIAARYLLSNTRDKRVKYVHFCGKTMTLSEFCEKENFGPRGKDLVKLADFAEEREGHLPSFSQEKIHELAQDYVDKEGFDLNVDYFCESLRALKFSEWDSDSQHIAKQSMRKQHFHVFTSLLNAYIVTEKRRLVEREVNCGVTSIIDNNDMWLEVLRSSISRRNPKRAFIPTAVWHILSRCNKQRRIESLAYCQDSEYGLTYREKREWENFVTKLNRKDATQEASDLIADQDVNEQNQEEREDAELLDGTHATHSV